MKKYPYIVKANGKYYSANTEISTVDAKEKSQTESKADSETDPKKKTATAKRR